MKKLLLFLLLPLAVLSASAQSNDYNMVIELKNGTTITLGADDVENLTFNGEELSISGNTIEEIIAALATKADKSELSAKADKSEIEELRALISKLQEKVTPSVKEFTVNDVTFKMIRVDGGTFRMGATSEQGTDYYSWERPVHNVTLSDYYIGETEVTQALWYAVMGQKPTSDGSKWASYLGLGDNYPAYNISWDDCQEFVTALSDLTGQTFRLPTEAEWEFAARGGNVSQGFMYAGSNTVDDVAWYWYSIPTQTSSSPGYGTQPVAMKAPNELGLYDMSGNMLEWCLDWYDYYDTSAQTNPTGPETGAARIVRGGCWRFDARDCRVSMRNNGTQSFRSYYYGMRLAL